MKGARLAYRKWYIVDIKTDQIISHVTAAHESTARRVISRMRNPHRLDLLDEDQATREQVAAYEAAEDAEVDYT